MNNEIKVFPSVSYDVNLGKEVDYIDIDLELLSKVLIANGLSEQEILDTEILISNNSNVYEKNGEKFFKSGHYDSKNGEIVVFLKDNIELAKSDVEKYRTEYQGNDKVSDEVLANVLDDLISEDIAGTLFHELMHRIDFIVKGSDTVSHEQSLKFEEKFGNPDKKYKKSMIYLFAGTIASLASMKFMPQNDRVFVQAPASVSEFMGMIGVGSSLIKTIKSYKYVKSHEGYLDQPHEVRAREFSAKMLELLRDEGILAVDIWVKSNL